MDPFRMLTPEVLAEIVGFLDPPSIFAVSETSPLFRSFVQFSGILPVAGPAFTPQSMTGPAATASSVSFASTISTSSSHADHDHPSSDTDLSSSPEEDEWEFVVTDDMIARLAAIPRRNHDSQLENLPTELQLMIFRELDKIDSCCLGLAHPNLYVVYRAIHGTKMPLNTRRIGPNSLESAWEVVGRQECKQCGVYRCELHTHIKSWMPSTLEYCAMKQNFGLPARAGASETCYRGKPSKPRRCGRHPTRTTSVHQDDAHFNLTTVA